MSLSTQNRNRIESSFHSSPLSPSSARPALSSRLQQRRSIPELPLKHFRLSSATLQRYQCALNEFLTWCDLNRVRISNDEQLDLILSSYFQSLYHQGQGLHHATYALFGLYNDKPRLHGTLKEAEAALKGWKKVEPVKHRTPINWEVAVSMAMWMATHNQVAAAVATLVGFNGYLRVSELASLKVAHVNWPKDVRTGAVYGGVALFLPRAKTGDYQSVKIRHPGIAKLLIAWISASGRGADESVFGLSASRYRDIMKSACVALKIEHVEFTPHCLRHGGATRDFLFGVPLEEIVLVGRWASSKSAKTYIQQGVGLMMASMLPPRIMQLGIKYGAHIYESMISFLPKPSTAA